MILLVDTWAGCSWVVLLLVSPGLSPTAGQLVDKLRLDGPGMALLTCLMVVRLFAGVPSSSLYGHSTELVQACVNGGLRAVSSAKETSPHVQLLSKLLLVSCLLLSPSQNKPHDEVKNPCAKGLHNMNNGYKDMDTRRETMVAILQTIHHTF